MNEIVENLYFLVEIASILLMLWALHGSKKRPGIYTIIFVCMALIIENAVSLKYISSNYIIVVYLGIIFLNILEFKDSIKDALLYGLFNIIIVFIIQYIIGMLLIAFSRIYVFDSVKLLLLQVIFFMVVFVLYRMINFQKLCKVLLDNNILTNVIIITSGFSSVFYMAWVHMRKYMKWENVIYLAIFFIVIFILLYEWQRENYISKQKSAELELFQQYNSIYQDLILSMRKRQHDFDNHLQAILSMNMTAKDLDTLIKQQNEYSRELMKDNGDSIFLKEDMNSVYLAFLYTKKKRAEELGIDVSFRLDCRDIESHLSFMDFITVAGNLFDNAAEAVQRETHKIILFEMMQHEHSVLFCVFNTYSFSDEELPADFLRGKSKKGEGHGLGLSNVADIVKRYHGIMENSFELLEQEKYYKISLQLFWKEE